MGVGIVKLRTGASLLTKSSLGAVKIASIRIQHRKVGGIGFSSYIARSLLIHRDTRAYVGAVAAEVAGYAGGNASGIFDRAASGKRVHARKECVAATTLVSGLHRAADNGEVR